MLVATLIPEAIEYEIPHIPTTLFMSWVVWLFLIIVSIHYAKKATLIPSKGQSFFEMIFSFVFTMADEIIGSEARRFYPLLAGIFIFILVSNLIGLIPGFYSPTSDANTTFGLAIMIFFYYHFLGIKKHGLKYIKHFLGPKLPWYLFPISVLFVLTEVMTIFVKPFSMGLRLFCNIYAKEILLAILAFLIIQFFQSPELINKFLVAVPLIMRPFIVVLGVILSLIQSLVFLILTIFYIAGAKNSAEH